MIISFIGAGNMANQLGQALYAAGHTIHEIYNRTQSSGRKIAKALEATYVSKIKDLSADVDILILAVSDDAIAAISSQIDRREMDRTIVVHTSGSVSMDVISKFKKHGVFYPFQSMTSGQQMDFRQVPILLTANSIHGGKQVQHLAASVSDQVFEISDEQRGVIHIAGVFANNFSNHMLTIAKQILDNEKLPFEIIKPLITNTLDKVQFMDPKDGQTGPAVRGDQKTIDKHMEWLESNSNLSEVYTLLTTHIKNTHKAT